jgi:hypothetical protein
MNYHYHFEKEAPPPLPAKVFDKNIVESVVTKRLKDRIEVTLPCGINDVDKSFTFTMHDVDYYTIEFRDGGKALQELAKRVDLTSFKKRLDEFCKREGRLSIRGGRELVLTCNVQNRHLMLWHFYDFYSYCALVANFDLYPLSQNMAWYGKEDLDE